LEDRGLPGSLTKLRCRRHRSAETNYSRREPCIDVVAAVLCDEDV
jgi:hypothetical protein